MDKYYIGSTKNDPSERLKLHLNKTFGSKKFTAKASDWKLFYVIECPDFSIAINIESHIKRMKSRKYIENLTVYPEMTNKLLFRFSKNL